ncbi:Serpin B12 [Tupaia chinensis]|uniref:Serpin B12 n=1 Tax=Tupaia chinensis TaxID=246437 RepID=L9L9D0_TUPCH|nr:Serpin B12 [Tupaia chinensis]
MRYISTKVLHFNELSQSESKEPDPCLKRNKLEVPADSSLEGEENTKGSLNLQAKSSKDENQLLSCYFEQLLSKLDRIRTDYTLSIANRLYGEQEFPVCPEFLEAVIKFYHTTIESVDFRKETEKSRQEINFWVESQSQGKIKELFSKDTISEATVLVLVNAVYFKAKWEKHFDCENTVDAPFSLTESEKKNVKMMHQKGLFRIGFIEELKAQILEMKYTKGKLSMFVLLPTCSEDNVKALEELERKITHEKIEAWSSSENMSEETVALSFPQFILEDSYNLNAILQDMGIKDIFDETKANLTGISPSPNLYLSKVVHKTFVELERKITHEKIEAWSSSENMSEETVALSFPQFILEDSYNLNAILQDMGIKDIFDETKANLTGISPSPNLYLSKVVHKTFVEVDEYGTQAAAATGAVGMAKSMPRCIEFNADHPFLFFVKHNKTQTILFYGRVCCP